MSATKTTEASLYSTVHPIFCPASWTRDLTLTAKWRATGRPRISAGLVDPKIAAKGNVFDTGIARQLDHGFTLKAGLHT